MLATRAFLFGISVHGALIDWGLMVWGLSYDRSMGFCYFHTFEKLLSTILQFAVEQSCLIADYINYTVKEKAIPYIIVSTKTNDSHLVDILLQRSK